MDEIIAAAAALGKQIAGHSRTREFMTAARAVASDADAQRILREFQEQRDRMHELEVTGQPVEPAIKRKVAALQEQVAGNDKLKAMMRTQADYLELMNRVYQAIEAAVQE